MSTWFRDYIYFPLGGSKKGSLTQLRNIWIVFLMSGLWHGASFTFLLWGLLHAFAFAIHLAYVRVLGHGKVTRCNTVTSFCGWLLTYSTVCLAWIPFRAVDLHETFQYFSGIVRCDFETIEYSMLSVSTAFFVIFVAVIYEWPNNLKEHALSRMPRKKLAYIIRIFPVFYLTVISWGGEEIDFIYFQF